MRNEADDDKVSLWDLCHRPGTMSEGAFRLALSINLFGSALG